MVGGSGETLGDTALGVNLSQSKLGIGPAAIGRRMNIARCWILLKTGSAVHMAMPKVQFMQVIAVLQGSRA